MADKCSPLPLLIGVVVSLAAYFLIQLIIKSTKSNYTSFMQGETGGMDFPISNLRGYRNPTEGLPIQRLSTSSSITNDILAPARAKSVMPQVQETVIWRGPMDEAKNLPTPTMGVIANEISLNPNIVGLSN